KRLERKSTRRRRGGTTGSGLAAERDRRSESRGRSCSRSGKGRLAPPIPVMPKNCRSERFLPSAVVQLSCKIFGAAAGQNYEHGSTAMTQALWHRGAPSSISAWRNRSRAELIEIRCGKARLFGVLHDTARVNGVDS